MKKILIVSPSYNEQSGGVVVLHKLCAILNEAGYQAFLFPHTTCHEYVPVNPYGSIFDMLSRRLLFRFKCFFKIYKLSGFGKTPVIFSQSYIVNSRDEWIVIYPEAVRGNPLNIPCVVRWMLHHPGFHTNSVAYNSGELYFRYNEGIKSISIEGSKTSNNLLKIFYCPSEYYNMKDAFPVRTGTAYAIRKGRGKEIVHDLNDSIIIDGMSNCDISRIFKKVHTFYSYDVNSAYSMLAVLCGCRSIIIPDHGVSKVEWGVLDEDRYGVEYGLNDADWGDATKNLLFERINTLEENSVAMAIIAAEEMDAFFS